MTNVKLMSRFCVWVQLNQLSFYHLKGALSPLERTQHSRDIVAAVSVISYPILSWYRWQPAKQLSLSLSLFLNLYWLHQNVDNSSSSDFSYLAAVYSWFAKQTDENGGEDWRIVSDHHKLPQVHEKNTYTGSLLLGAPHCSCFSGTDEEQTINKREAELNQFSSVS